MTEKEKRPQYPTYRVLEGSEQKAPARGQRRAWQQSNRGRSFWSRTVTPAMQRQKLKRGRRACAWAFAK